MTRKAWLALILVLACAVPALAQKITVTGTVYEPEGEPAIGASVAVQGNTNMGVVTDYDGNYSIQVAPDATLVFSYIGCDTKTEAVNGRTKIDVHLTANSVALQEVVAIGYGTVKKSDATGSVGVVKPNEIEAGLATSAQDLLVGASPGVVVTTSGGEPYGGAQIRIRGGASLSATNEPLIVIDGVPMSNMGVKGVSNPLSLVNPENIESMTILKDASATAIYGSRASNGVIIITTKSGKSGKPQVNFAANFFVNTPRNYMDMMDGERFRQFIIDKYGDDSAQAAALGNANTNWQKEVLRTSFSQDYSLSIGGQAGFLPYRVAIGYTNNQGIVRETGMDRLSASINLTPKFFDDLLSVNANVKGAYINNKYENGSPLGSAVSFNPTLPVYNPEGNVFKNYTTYVKGGIAGPTTPGTEIDNLQPYNPVSLVNENTNKSRVYQSVGNLQLDLKMPFLRELSANLNLGYDYTHGDQTSLWAPFSPRAWESGFTINRTAFPQYPAFAGNDNNTANIKEGYTNRWVDIQKSYTLLLDFVLTYNKKFDAIKSELNVQGGYSWQKFKRDGHNFGTVDKAIAGADNADLHQFNGYQYTPTQYNSSPYQLVSFFGRLNYIFAEKYLLTATVRHDGTSRFGKEHRWGTFPAFALGWKILEEGFMEDARSFMNELKLRAGYGVTGQQGLDDDFFPYLQKYYISTNQSGRYPIDGATTFPLNPDKYNADLKWESTHTWNVGLDFAFLNNRITGSFEWYQRKTKDLLLFATYPAGSNLSNDGMINAGDMENTGIEFNITARPVQTRDFTWTSAVNVAWNKNKITRLADGYNGFTGPDIDKAGKILKHEVGQPASTFFVYEQAYDAAGNPLEGVYVDQNGDGIITPDDRIKYHSINPDVTMTWNNTFNYKNWDLGIVLRGSFNNWVYNQGQMGNSFISSTQSTPLSNLLDNVYLFNSTRTTELMQSNYFVQNASFVRCDNITLGYTWENLINGALRLRAFGAVQNPFVITKYKGLDPEVASGVDNSPYPRPITVSLGVVATF